MRRALGWVLLLALAGCRYGYTRVGHDDFVSPDFVPVPGQTTVLELTAALGSPQSVHARSGDLVLHYRFREIDNRSLVLRYFGGQWLQYHDKTLTDRSLIAVFDAHDRLRYLAPSIRDAE